MLIAIIDIRINSLNKSMHGGVIGIVDYQTPPSFAALLLTVRLLGLEHG